MIPYSDHFLKTPIAYLKGVGPLRAELLIKELGIATYQDLLFYFPFRYMDRSSFVNICNIEENKHVQLFGKITHFEIIENYKKSRAVATLKDATGNIELVWFQFLSSVEKNVIVGENYIVYGKAVRFQGFMSINHPEMDAAQGIDLEKFPSYIPVYSSTEKLRAKWLSGRNFVKIVQQLFVATPPKEVVEVLPENILRQYRLCDRFFAIKNIHFPENANSLHKATYRMKFEELFLHQINICKLKLNHRKHKGFVFEKVGKNFLNFYHHHLPFELTGDQKKVLKEIRRDTQTGVQMNRLLQGDVGSGKTIVALLCMLLAIDNGYQACIMAPTEILALQHFENFKSLLQAIPIQVGFISGKTKAKEKKWILNELQSGNIHIVIGTHALLEDKVMFQNLGLCIIDEQHRFGVAQRAKLWEKNIMPPHILVMTATPIPRTLAMTSYGDLDLSIIQELPPGRKPISTVHRTESYRAKVMDFLKSEVDQGRQVYIVYPLIDESEKLDYENLYAGYEQVKQYFPPHQYNIAMVHGKQDVEERNQNMQSFVHGKAHIMVATTVIEVGVNVPNASVMLIESAERFGLAQLHQLRGRVGRGADKSYCILLTGTQLSDDGKERIKTMVTEQSGFAIAEKDLQLRGPGEIDGKKQSGISDFKIADIVKDVELMAITRKAAIELLIQDPELNDVSVVNLKTYLLSKKDKELWSRIS